MPIKFLALGLFWGGSARFIFVGTGISLLNTLLGHGWNTVSTILLRKRELTEFCGKLTELCGKLGSEWVHFGTQIKGRKELTELFPWNSVRAKKLTEFGIRSRTLRNRIRPVSETKPGIARCFVGYRASIAEIPLLWGGEGIAHPLPMLLVLKPYSLKPYSDRLRTTDSRSLLWRANNLKRTMAVESTQKCFFSSVGKQRQQICFRTACDGAGPM